MTEQSNIGENLRETVARLPVIAAASYALEGSALLFATEKVPQFRRRPLD